MALCFCKYTLILNLILATHFTEVGTGATKNRESCKNPSKTQHSTGPQSHIKWAFLKGPSNCSWHKGKECTVV